MKKVVSILAALSTAVIFLCYPANALSNTEIVAPSGETVISQTSQTLDNGMTVVSTISESTSQVTNGMLSQAATTVVYKNGTRTYTYYNGSTKLFSFSVHGAFTVNLGVSATCTSTYYSYTLDDSAWEFDSGTTWRSGNKAYGDGNFYRQILFITVETREALPILVCDSYGNFSGG